MADAPPPRRPLRWVGSSREDLRRFPKQVRITVAFALFQAELGGKHVDAKPMRGFGGAGVLEVVADHDRSTFRTVYTVKFPSAVYVLHAFQKKSKKGSETPKAELEKIRDRLKIALEHHREHYEQQDDNQTT